MQSDEPIKDEQPEQLNQDGQTPPQPADPNPSATGDTADPVAQVEDTSTQSADDDYVPNEIDDLAL